ncbi:MAG: transporter substrate-binding domain-containing protein [Solobacterium sp.]|nr:transporter substrate-binding domain-containing protein [Solobacterium sp.]
MKKLTKSALAALLAMGIAGCSTSSNSAANNATEGKGDHLARIKEAGTIIVGLEGDWQPFSFHDDSDALIGFDVEVAQNIAERIGVEISIIESPWDTLFTGMESGQFDMVVNGVDVTEDRSKSYDFSDPYAYDHTVLVVKADEAEIKTFEDLDGKTTANSIGSTYMEIGESYGAKVQGVDTLSETMSMVINEQVDATINAETSVQDYLNTTGETRVVVVDKLEESTAYAIPLVKGEDNATLLEAVNKALADMRSDGTLAEISVKYFGNDLTNN